MGREPKPRPPIKIRGAMVLERRTPVAWDREGADLLARVRDDAERLPAETVGR